MHPVPIFVPFCNGLINNLKTSILLRCNKQSCGRESVDLARKLLNELPLQNVDCFLILVYKLSNILVPFSRGSLEKPFHLLLRGGLQGSMSKKKKTIQTTKWLRAALSHLGLLNGLEQASVPSEGPIRRPNLKSQSERL